jgi:hypothetical protein
VSRLVLREVLSEEGSINLAARDVDVERTASLRASDSVERLNLDRLRPSSLPREVAALEVDGDRASPEIRRKSPGRGGESLCCPPELSPEPDKEAVGEWPVEWGLGLASGRRCVVGGEDKC